MINQFIRRILATPGATRAKDGLCLLIVGLAVALWSPATLSATLGAPINNAVQVTYTIGGIAGVSAPVGTDPVAPTVVASSSTNTAVVNLTASSTQHVYAADVVTINVAVTNAGNNTLSGAQVRVTVPINVTATLDSVAPVSSNTVGNQTTHAFDVLPISALTIGSAVTTVDYQLDLTMPATIADLANNSVDVAYFANTAVLDTKSVSLDLSNRTAVNVLTMQYSASTPTHNEVVVVTEFDTTGAGSYSNLPVPTEVTGAAIPLQTSTTFSHSQNMYLRVADMDHNTDSAVQEKITLNFVISTGDTETLRLLETGVDTGIFTGYAMLAAYGATPTSNNGLLEIDVNSNVAINYTDAQDAGDVLDINIIVDPYGKVFDSSTGLPLVGYRVTLVDADTGLDAVVYGDDGVSIYPSTIITGDGAGIPATDGKGDPVTDDSGASYTFDPGSYRFPLAVVGNYKLVVVPPASSRYVFPSVKSIEEINRIPNGPFVITQGSKGEVFYLPPGPPLNIDIPVDSLTENIYVRRTANKNQVSAGDFIQFRVEIENLDGGILADLQLTDVLPHGFRYEAGSARLSSSELPTVALTTDPAIASDGKTLSFSLGTHTHTPGKVTLEYVAAVGAVNSGTTNSTSQASAGGIFSNTSTLNTNIVEELLRSRAVLMGRIIIAPQEYARAPQVYDGLAGVRVYMEDGRYAVSDDKGRFHFDNVLPGTHVVQMDLASLPKQYEVIAKNNSSRFAGRPWSQFVDVQGGTLWRSDFYVRAKEGYLIESAQPVEHGQGTFDLKQAFPDIDALVNMPSTKMSIEHFPEERVKLTLNGKEVPAENFVGVTNNEAGATISEWSGIDLLAGKNVFVATIVGQNGEVTNTVTRNVVFSDYPVEAELVEAASTLIADGVSRPVIAIRFKDKDGYPARIGVVGDFHLSPPYKIADLSNFERSVLPGAAENRPEYRIGEAGIAYITLEPSNESGDVKIRLPLANERIIEIEAPLKAKQSDWIVVGLAEGTAGYNTLKGNLEPLTANAADETYEDGRVALFAKGQVSGKWLLTMAYDSAKERDRKQDPKIFQAIDPNKFYTIYGDSAHQGYAAASSEKLYLRLESDEFFFLYGDYQTGLSDTQLTRYNRTLTGVKSRYHDELIDIIVFGSESNQAFVKDEIRGEGKSGPYRLTRSNVAMNTETVSLEVRDRFQSQDMVESKELTRHIDYDIDYNSGTILFRQPIQSTDFSLNPRYIVVRYESYDQGDLTLTSGGRTELTVAKNTKVGVVHITEGRTGGNAEVNGADLRIQLGGGSELRAEVAQSKDQRATEDYKEGSAYKLELNQRSSALNSKLYLSEQESNFGLGQNINSESGRRKYGAEARLNLNSEFDLEAKAIRDENISTLATRDLYETKGHYRLKSTNLRLGARSVQDDRGNGSQQISEQLTAGISQSLLDGRMALRVDREENLDNKQNNSIDYPNRTKMGMDYHLTQKSTLFVEQEIADGDVRDTTNTLLGIKSTPWQGGNVYAGVKRQQASGGSSSDLANLAIAQKWQITKVWSMDFAAEEVRTLSDVEGTPLNASTPFSSGSTGSGGVGSSDYTSGSVALTYAPKHWLWSSRIENRRGSTEESLRFASSVQSSPDANLSTISSLQLYNSKQSLGGKADSIDIGLGIAYRPTNNRWLMIDKLDLRWGDVSNNDFSSEEWRVVNNFSANYQPAANWQLAFQFAAKSVKETINNIDYESVADLVGIESRYDISKTWDVGVHSNVLHVWNIDQYDYSSGLSTGHVVAKNIWISLGYNFTGFRDEDFSRSRYTSEGAYLKFRMKFDQRTFKEAKR